MWARLKEDYINEEEPFLWACEKKGVEKNTPIRIHLHSFSLPSFLLNGGRDMIELKYLTLEILSLPGECSMDEKGNVFCVNRNKFYDLEHSFEKPDHCPGCGESLVPLAEFPQEEFNQNWPGCLIF